MNKSAISNAASVIEIGSSSVKLCIAQKKKGNMVIIDSLSYPIGLGHDVYETSKISFDSLHELSDILRNYTTLTRSYGIEKIKTISCSVMREAKNRSLVSDQIKVLNGIDLHILEPGEEKSLLHFEISKLVSELDDFKEGAALFVSIGSAVIGISVYLNESIVYSQNLPIGTLKLPELFGDTYRHMGDFYIMQEEYILSLLKRLCLSKYNIKHLVFTGGDCKTIAELCGGKKLGEIHYALSADFKKIYKDMRVLTPEKISSRYGPEVSRANTVYTALGIYDCMLSLCPDVSKIYMPTISITNAFIRQALSPREKNEYLSFAYRSAIRCSKELSIEFEGNPKHSDFVDIYSCKLFDKMKKYHGLATSHRLLLEISAILHGSGGTINIRRYSECTANIIQAMDIIGLSPREVSMIAYISGYHENDLDADIRHGSLDIDDELVVSKLAAIFRLANALDKSQKQKLGNIKLSFEGEKLLIYAESSANANLEKWAFKKASLFFRDVFGLYPELIVKSNLF